MPFTTVEDRVPRLEQAVLPSGGPDWGPELQELPEPQEYCAEVGMALPLALA